MSRRPSSPALLADNFWSEVSAHPIVVVHFWVGWSQPDYAMIPIVEQVRSEYASITFFSVDIDGDGGDVADWFKADTTPALLCFLNGDLHDSAVGFMNADSLRAKLREWLLASTSDAPLDPG